FTPTRFPGVRLKPLGHPSCDGGSCRACASILPRNLAGGLSLINRPIAYMSERWPLPFFITHHEPSRGAGAG
ncbi:MAG: hypothetical protein ACPH9S_11725, partial [Candidatus Puniceispirillaceae bacterium]